MTKSQLFSKCQVFTWTGLLTLKLKLLCSVLCSYAISKNSFAILTIFQYQKTCNVIGGDLKNLTKTFVMEFSV